MNLDCLPPAPGYFVAGTDTGAGKTYVACALIEALKRRGARVAAMKPVAAGVEGDGSNEDVRRLVAAANVAADPRDVNPYCFAPPIAPHVAAQRAGVVIALEVIANAFERLCATADVVIVEGAGGLLVPIDDMRGMDSIPQLLDLPVILVVGMRLGCINHALLSAEALRARGLRLVAWVANEIDPLMEAKEENFEALAQRLGAPCLARLPWTPPAGEGNPVTSNIGIY
ncbi:MAG: dethiobiotin synthase [Thiobacillus sp.]